MNTHRGVLILLPEYFHLVSHVLLIILLGMKGRDREKRKQLNIFYRFTGSTQISRKQ